MKRFAIAVAIATTAMAPRAASAFCGFYIDTGGSQMVNNATEVVMMRAGTRTVLAMQNNYQGPVQDFAMVVPVPTVLHDGDVKTLDRAVFAKVDKMSSPRLVEYWEQDPCRVEIDDDKEVAMSGAMPPPTAMPMKSAAADYHVTIEAQFVVGEYDVVILSAKDSTGLDGYLRAEHYQIPASAEPLLRPYVESGMKFFVAKVDPKKVKFEHGQAMLSPLRFHYDDTEFALPIRLGLANSAGTQDLIVNIIAASRYEVANYKNVFVPTNLDVKDPVRQRFGEFYAALFDRVVDQNPGAVVTEYAWNANTCDPCPGPTLDDGDFKTLGADVLGDAAGGANGFVLTRLHARYGKGGVPNDLVFRTAPPAEGGRETTPEARRAIKVPADADNFQARYVIRHAWTGPIACANPQRGIWGGNPAGDGEPSIASPDVSTAFAPRGAMALPSVVAENVPEIGVTAGAPIAAPTAFAERPAQHGCGCQSGGGAGGLLVGGAVLGLVIRPRRHARASKAR